MTKIPPPAPEMADEPLLTNAKVMRSHQTDAEIRLWYRLRAKRFMGLKFKRQKTVGIFIVDFVCLELGLIIEADGSQHGDVHDRQRDAWLEGQGFKALRFWNNDILQNTEGVLERIREVVISLSPALAPSPPAPLPLVGEGGVPPPST